MGDRVLVTTLTKRMAENLTEYLAEHDVKVRYLHSDIETVERSEIIRDLRLGEFDVLVGINLLREGLDMPEVSLVAILDADKEGFLRSTGSLIQTIGRAARNVRGKAILYADTVTRSMQAAMDETARRREKQVAWNEAARHHAAPPSCGASPTSWRARAARPGNRRGSKRHAGGEAAVAEECGRLRRRSARSRPPPRSRSWRRRCTSTPRTWSSRTPPGCATRSTSCGSRRCAELPVEVSGDIVERSWLPYTARLAWLVLRALLGG